MGTLLAYELAKKYTEARLEATFPSYIYGVQWDKGSSPTLTRTHDAVGMVAAAGVGGGFVSNDFDNAQIFREIGQVIDTLGNVFIRIPKFYIRKTDGTNFKTWQVSKYRYPGLYLPWCFWDFDTSQELDYIDIGKYKASLGAGDKLESKAGVHPLINTHIVNMRTYARNNNAGGLLGYQQLDIHVYDLLQTLMTIEFATLNMQSVMQGYTTGRYSAGDKAVAATDPAGNVIIVSNTTGAHYRVGQAISVGTSLGGNQRFYGRQITALATDTPIAGQTTITFDGDPVVLATDDIMYNTGWRNGFSAGIAASSGSLVSNADGKHPCVYRGIESPYGDMWQFVDGVNINERQAWTARNAADYASNVFASPYEQLSYVNHSADGYVTAMGYDVNRPFAGFPTAVGGGSTTFYSDYYYQTTGQRIALVGGSWYLGASAGPWCWSLGIASSDASVSVGGRLLRKPL